MTYEDILKASNDFVMSQIAAQQAARIAQPAPVTIQKTEPPDAQAILRELVDHAREAFIQDHPNTPGVAVLVLQNGQQLPLKSLGMPRMTAYGMSAPETGQFILARVDTAYANFGDLPKVKEALYLLGDIQSIYFIPADDAHHGSVRVSPPESAGAQEPD